jgi:hypothetical protein
MATLRVTITFRVGGQPIAESPWESAVTLTEHRLLDIVALQGGPEVLSPFFFPGAFALIFDNRVAFDLTGDTMTLLHGPQLDEGGCILSTSSSDVCYSTSGRIRGLLY